MGNGNTARADKGRPDEPGEGEFGERRAIEREIDVLVVGAGLSGIGTAHHLLTAFPARDIAVIEARGAIGGTWDLFRYPGVRSDSDMPTLGYAFRPWTGDRALADGPSILRYIRDTAREGGIEERIRFGHKLIAADWSFDTARWTVAIEVSEGDDVRTVRWRCRFLHLCTGYYDYEKGHAPRWEGMDAFGGETVHPQHWPAGFDPAGKRIVVIGSGATAVTLVPELAREAEHVTMLQRSPGFIVAAPGRDAVAERVRRWFGPRFGHGVTRWKNIGLVIFFYQFARRLPRVAANAMLKGMAKELGPNADVTALTPRYDPWDQRVCLVPDGDLFAAVREGRASIVTDRIERFEADGIRLASGEVLPADAVVTATGLTVKVVGGAAITVEGRPVDMAETYSYKGAMYSGLPNLSVALGYINASWTLKCELIARYAVRLLRHMERRGHDWAMPLSPPPGAGRRSTFELTSGYVERARHLLPKQTDRGPWKLKQNYVGDLALMRLGRVTDAMAFGRAGERPPPAPTAARTTAPTAAAPAAAPSTSPAREREGA